MITNYITKSDTLSYGMFRGLNNKFQRQFPVWDSGDSPGCVFDSNKAIGLFERYKNRSRKAKKLYWKYHKLS